MHTMEKLEACINKADVVLSESHAALVSEGSSALPGHASLSRKLAAIYADETIKANRLKSQLVTYQQSVSQIGQLIGKLVERNSISCLVVNLHRGNEGYSIALKLPGGLETETIRLPYEDNDFLSYLDQELLPPMLLDLLDDAGVADLYQSGCLVAEIRDYRRFNYDPNTLGAVASSAGGSSPQSDTRHVLLRPTMQSVAADIALLTRDKEWSSGEKLRLESEVIRATAPPLCLSPNMSASLLSRRLHSHTRSISTPTLHRAVKRNSQISLNKQKKFEEGPAPKCLRLLNFLNERKDKRPLAKSIPKPLVPLATDRTTEPVASELFDGVSPSLDTFMKTVVEEVEKHTKPLDRPPETNDNSLHFVEEYTLETEKGAGRIYLTKLTIYQRRTDEVFCGELYVDRDYQEGKANGSTCTFKHSSLQSVHRYITQFREIFSEVGRKSVKITHNVAGQPVRVFHTQGSRDRSVQATEQVRQTAAQQQQPLKQQLQQQPIKQQQLQQQQVQQSSSSTAAPGVTVSAPQYTSPNLLIVANGEKQSNGTVQHKPTAADVAVGVVVCRPSAALQQQHVLQQQPQQQHVVTQQQHIVQQQKQHVVQQSPQQQHMVQQQATRVHHSSNQLSGAAVGQQVLLSNNLHLSNLLAGRVAVTSSQLLHHTTTSPHKIHTSSSTGLTTGLGMGIMAGAKVPALQQLLAGTPSAENPAPGNSRGASLIERLTQQAAQPNKSDIKPSVKVDSTASALPTITTINTTATTGSLVCSTSGSQQHQQQLSSLVSNSSVVKTLSNSSNSAGAGGGTSSSPASAVLRSDAGTAPPPPNINIANITNLPGLNVGLQNLTSGLSGLQNVQVSIPGLPVPISLSVNPSIARSAQQQVQQQQGGVGSSSGSSQSSHPVIIASPQHQHHTVSGAGGNSSSSAGVGVSTAQTVVLTTSTSLPQGHLLHLPIVQGSQLAAQLTKTSTPQQTSINVLQNLSSSGSSLLTTSISSRSGSAVSSNSAVATVGSSSSELLVSSASLLPLSVLPRGSKQQLQLNQQGKLSQHLQQKLMQLAAKKSQQQQQLQLQLQQQQLQQQQQQ